MITLSIVTWNCETTIVDCLDSIKKQTIDDFQILIIDNNSEDNTVNIIQNYYDKRIQFHALNSNLGFTGGHNLALKHALGEFILFVNPDIVLRQDYLENAVFSFEQNPQFGCINGLLLQICDNLKTTIIDSAGLCFARSRRFFLRYSGQDIGDVRLSREEIFGCDGALPFYRSQMIKDLSINGEFFDEAFFAHKEDWDVAWRARLFGWKTIFEPKCVAWHVRSFRPGNLHSRKMQSPTTKIHAIKNQFYLIVKNDRMSDFLRDFPFIIARQLAIFIFSILTDIKSLKAYYLVVKNLPALLKKRREIKKRQRLVDNSPRKWLYTDNRLNSNGKNYKN